MLKNRSMPTEVFEKQTWGAVGLVQGKLIELFTAADLAETIADVYVVEVKGMCPQHLSMIAILGDTASVEEALKGLTVDEERVV